MYFPKIIIAILTFTLLSACGFQLRGSLAFNLPEGVEPIYISGSNTNRQLYNELSKLLKAYEVQLTENVSDANHQLLILEQTSDRRIASIGRGARAAEIQLIEKVSFEIRNKQGQKISGPNTINEQRILQNDPNQVASTSSEESLLRKEMLMNLASKVARQVNAANYQNTNMTREGTLSHTQPVGN